AAAAASTAAPVYRAEPAATPTTPRVYLSSSGPGRGTTAATSAADSTRSRGSGRYGSSPMSTSSTRPATTLPGPTTRPGFRQPNVPVTSASNAGPGTAPVSLSTPDGTSTATRSAPDSRASSASQAAAGRRAPLPPMPTTPSST